MELYKLYCVLKRHTGFETMYQIQRRIMMPEWYAKRRERGMHAARRLALMASCIQTINGSEYLN